MSGCLVGILRGADVRRGRSQEAAARPERPLARAPRPFVVLFDKVRVGPGRLVVAAIWLVFLYAIVKRFEPMVMRWTGWFLEPFGRNSHYVYIVQSALVFPLFNPFVRSFWVATVEEVFVLAAVWVMVKKRVLFDWIPR